MSSIYPALCPNANSSPLTRRSVIRQVACLAGAIRASADPAFDNSDKIAILQMFERYAQAYVKKDYTTIRECVQAPFVFLTGSEMRALESVDAVVTAYRNWREALDQRGYDHAEILETRITPLTAGHALINAAYRRYRKDGSLLEEGAAVYPVIKSAGKWKLSGTLFQDLKYFGKIY